MRIQCDYLLEFATVANLGTFTKAATKLGISHTSLRQHVKSLETCLGVTLLDRSTEGVSLTEAGRIVYNRAIDVEEILNRIEFDVGPLQTLRHVTLYGMAECPRFVVMMNAATRDLKWEGHRVAVDILPAPPKMEVDEILKSARKSNDSVVCLVPESADVATRCSDLSGRAGMPIVGSTLYNAELVALVDRSHPLASRDGIALHDLSGQTIIHSDSGYGGSRRWWFALREYLRIHDIDFRSANFSLSGESDWIVDFGPNVVVLPAVFRAVALIEAAGKACIPIVDATLPFVAFWCRDDQLAQSVGSIELN